LQMYKDFSGTDPYTEPMMVTPAAHFTMGGIEVNYLLESHIPGCFVVGEAAHSIHAFNRLGANALQQTVQDGMFILPAGMHDYFSRTPAMTNLRDLESQALRLAHWWQEELKKRMKQKGQYESVMELQQELGRIMYQYAGAVRSEDGLHKGLAELEMLKERLKYAVVGEELAWNTTLTDYLTLQGHVALAEYVFRDALGWTQSRGAQWREDFPEPDYTDNAIHVWKRVKGGRLQSESRQLQYPFTPQRSEH
jgi:succinate dehydrogenase / fumarate reductase flavoprotein subunit